MELGMIIAVDKDHRNFEEVFHSNLYPFFYHPSPFPQYYGVASMERFAGSSHDSCEGEFEDYYMDSFGLENFLPIQTCFPCSYCEPTFLVVGFQEPSPAFDS